MSSKLEEYDVINTLGSTCNGVVRKINKIEDGKILVWKEINFKWMSEAQRKALFSEVNLLKELNHRNIVQYYDKIIDHENSILYNIMEYCGGGDMKQLINHCKNEGIHLEEDLIWRILYQISQAFMECHNRNKRNGDSNQRSVIHRNIKPTNVFLDEWNNVKVGDFGLEILNYADSNRYLLSSNTYISPEQLNNSQYREKSDIWAIGCLIYELCTFSPPFYGGNNAQMAIKIRSGNFNRIPSSYSNELQNVISAMLTVEDILRPTIDLIVQHPRIVALNQRKMNDDWESRKFSFLHTPNKGKCPANALKDRLEVVKRREQAVRAKELLLDERQKDIEKREKKIVLKERMIEERLARAEIYLKQTKGKSSNGSSDGIINKKPGQYLSDPSIYKMLPNSKHVHFDQKVLDKENIKPNIHFKEYKFNETYKELWVDGPICNNGKEPLAEQSNKYKNQKKKIFRFKS